MENFYKKIYKHLGIYLGRYSGANTIKTYLILTNIILAVFAIWFSNASVLPFRNLGDFAVFAVLALMLALYRPGWTFVFFIGTLVLENINLAPESLGLAIRPYQLFGAITIVAFVFQVVTKRLPFSLPKFRWQDVLVIVFALSGFLSAFFSENFALSLKQSLVALSFAALYFLVRIYVQSFEDLKKIAPFFFSSAIVVLAYGVWQNVAFKLGQNSFEVMPGRPNATFTEPDWLGIYLVFLLAVFLTMIYGESKKTEIADYQKQVMSHKLQVFRNISIVTLALVALIIAVSRSAWLGAAFVMVGFLKIMLTNGSLRISQWNWGKFRHALKFLAITIISSMAIVYIFGLTRFQLFNRAVSTGGLQKITVACPMTTCILPEKINNPADLDSCGCWHINLEDIEKEKAAGNRIMEVYRPDPNINIRAGIYQKSFEQIKNHPVFGIGWGSIGKVLGVDERGASLNTSNIFLEVWLGAGMAGFLSFVILLGYIFIKGAIGFLKRRGSDNTVLVFVMLGLVAIVIPNFFNSGIFLGFLWAYLAVAVSLLEKSNAVQK